MKVKTGLVEGGLILLDCYFPVPPNTNHVYRHGNGMTYMTVEGKKYKSYVFSKIKELFPDFAIPPKTPLAITFTFNLPANKLNVLDIDGLLKILQDAIFETGRGNDAWIRQLTAYKASSEITGPYCQITLSTL